MTTDIIPIVPGRFLGFQHPHGEIHIISSGNAVACSGIYFPFVAEGTINRKKTGDDDATDPQCTIESVPNIAEGDILDHVGIFQQLQRSHESNIYDSWDHTKAYISAQYFAHELFGLWVHVYICGPQLAYLQTPMYIYSCNIRMYLLRKALYSLYHRHGSEGTGNDDNHAKR